MVRFHLTFPGYNYLGPGDSSELGPPVNGLDAIAKTHDDSYIDVKEKIKCREIRQEEATLSIQDADDTFIKDVWHYRPIGMVDRVAKYTGLSGILCKRMVESVVGVKYPVVSNTVAGAICSIM